MSSPSDTFTPEHVEHPYPGIVQEWYLNRSLVAYRLTSVTPGVLNAWSELVVETLKGWPKDTYYLALHDVSAMGISLQYATLVSFDLLNLGITAVGRQKAEDVFNLHPNFRGRVAIGFNLSVSGQVSQVVMDRIRSRHPAIQYRTFFNRERSLAWLMETLKPANTEG